jgi:hypothetical protein
MNLTLEELKSGLQSPFWRWFSLQYQQEWGEAAFGLRVAEVYRKRPIAEAGPLIQQMACAKQEVDRIFSLPKEQLDTMQAQERGKEAALQPGRRPVGL